MSLLWSWEVQYQGASILQGPVSCILTWQKARQRVRAGDRQTYLPVVTASVPLRKASPSEPTHL